MSLRNKLLNLGDLRGTIFDFEKAGDILPMHNHGDMDVHISVVARGSLRVHGDGWEKVITSGDVVDFSPNQRHEFIALEDNTRIVNIIKRSPRE